MASVSEARHQWGSYVAARDMRNQSHILVIYDVMEPTKPKVVKVLKAGERPGFFDNFDSKWLRIPMLLVVFGITAWYQLSYRGRNEKTESDNMIKRIEQSVGKNLDLNIKESMAELKGNSKLKGLMDYDD